MPMPSPMKKITLGRFFGAGASCDVAGVVVQARVRAIRAPRRMVRFMEVRSRGRASMIPARGELHERLVRNAALDRGAPRGREGLDRGATPRGRHGVRAA